MNIGKNLLLLLAPGAYIFFCINPPQSCAMASSTAGVATSGNQVLQLANDSTAILQRLRMIRFQIEQLRRFRRFSDLQWGEAMESLRALLNIIEQGQALAFSLKNVDQLFRNIFPGYVPPKDFSRAYETWTNVTTDSIASALAAAGYQSHQFASEEATMQTLRSLNGNVAGQTQAIQVGNLIVNQVIGQLQKLRTLQMSQLTALSAYIGHTVNKEAAMRAASDNFFQVIPRIQGGRRY